MGNRDYLLFGIGLFYLFFAPVPANALISGVPLPGHPDLVRLTFDNGTMCTGVFIDPHTILTAAHCVGPNKQGKLPVLDKVLSGNERELPIKQLGSFVHPDYAHNFWPRFDIGLIKTTSYSEFSGNFRLGRESAPRVGTARLFGCGISEFQPKTRARMTGENRFLRIGAVILFIGRSKNPVVIDGKGTSIAPNDSGAPVVEVASGEIIAVATQATAKESAEFGLPALSLATSITEKHTRDFISRHLEKPN